MKIRKSDINILIMVLGIAIAVCSYFFVYNSFVEKKATLDGENATLQQEVDELQKLADNKQFYLDETARMNAEITEIMNRFPPGMLVEDILMDVVNMEASYSIFYESVSVETIQQVQVAMEEPQQDAVQDGTEVTEETAGDAVVATGGLKETVFLYNTPITYGFKSTYRSIKDIISDIVKGNDRMNLQSVTLSYDGDTGCIQGSLAVNVYTMDGTGKYYELLNIPGVQLGVEDLFKSGTILNINTGTENEYLGDVDEEGEEGENQPVSEEN
ncbi:MAG: hypothetical protein HDR00_04915 [Lachnospiraceae bacterium]|nr:hypothetical protein [Lachnospiraceae bacterium]